MSLIDFRYLLSPAPPKRPDRARIALTEDDRIIYAIGDVHGCFDQLRRLEDAIFAESHVLPVPKLVIMLGDYVDRGGRSAEVMSHLLSDMPEGYRRICLSGNHEEAMLKFVGDPRRHVSWLDMGGQQTMASYGVDIRHLLRTHRHRPGEIARIVTEAIPKEHIDFLEGLPSMVSCGSLVFVHAGLRPGIALQDQAERDLLWIREPFLSQGPALPLTVVHGHTPASLPVVSEGRICVDTGAYLTGRLSAVRLFDGRIFFLGVG